MAFVTAIVAFAIFWVVTMLYLRAAHGLVRRVRDEHPDFWREELGSPEFVAHHRRSGLQIQYRFYLQPLFPFLRWVLAGSPAVLTIETRRQHHRTKQLLIASAVGFLVTVRLYLRLLLGW